jgi:hypothetical protein
VKIFFAGAASNENLIYQFGGVNKILTYADVQLKQNTHVEKFWVHSGEVPDACIFMDSGAFAGYTRGVKIDLEQYCAYIKRHEGLWHAVAGLDVIGDHVATRENCQRMRDLGVEPVETFHKASPISELEGILQRCGYLALGGLVSSDPGTEGKRGTTGRQFLQRHLDRCWDVIDQVKPRPRVHVFGVTSQWVLMRYPWYSADSAGAILSGAMGGVRTWHRHRRTSGRIESQHWRPHANATADRRGAPKKGDPRLVSFEQRLEDGVHAQLQLEWDVTEVWRRRGVTWD